MVTISTQAKIAIRSLLPQDRSRIERQIALLEHFLDDQNIRQQASPLGPIKDSYLMRATPQLRLLFKCENGEIEILDVVSHERLEKMFKH